MTAHLASGMHAAQRRAPTAADRCRPAAARGVPNAASGIATTVRHRHDAHRLHTAERYELPITVPQPLRPWFIGAGHIPYLATPGWPFTHIPETGTRLILRHESSGRRDVAVVGPRTHASYTAADESVSCLRLLIAPGAVRALLGIAAAELADGITPLGEFPGPLAEFADQLLDTSFPEAVSILEYALPQHIFDDRASSSQRALLDAATSAMVATPAPIPEIAAHLAVSERQLRNLFTTGIGVSPKHFMRIDRVRRLVSEVGNASLAQVAANAGYYDQSHMTADFRALMGIAPTRFFGGNLPEPIPCRATLTAITTPLNRTHAGHRKGQPLPRPQQPGQQAA